MSIKLHVIYINMCDYEYVGSSPSGQRVASALEVNETRHE